MEEQFRPFDANWVVSGRKSEGLGQKRERQDGKLFRKNQHHSESACCALDSTGCRTVAEHSTRETHSITLMMCLMTPDPSVCWSSRGKLN